MLNFPNSPVNGELSQQPNGITYQWSAADTRWNATGNSIPTSLDPYSIRYLIAGETFVPDVGCRVIKFTAVGGGGGGGGVDGQGSGTAVVGRAGAGAGTAIKTTTLIAASYIIGIGSGGAGGSVGADGVDGGKSTVLGGDVNIEAFGGKAGGGATGGTGSSVPVGTDGGLATGGDINLQGGGGQAGIRNSGARTALAISGASSLGGGLAIVNNAPAHDSVTFGEGGGTTYSTDVSANDNGGDGGTGVVIIEQWFFTSVTGVISPSVIAQVVSWARVGVNGGVTAGVGIASVIEAATGEYDILFDTPLSNTNYTVSCNSSNFGHSCGVSTGTIATTGFRIRNGNSAGSATSSTFMFTVFA